MRKIHTLLTAIFLLCACAAIAQKPLTNSRRSSLYTYIYKCTDAEVLLNFKLKNKSIDENWFKNPIDSFKTDEKWNNTLPPGNYFLISARENKVNYELVENHTAWVKILRNNVDTRFVITDAAGTQLNIPVTVNNNAIPFDKKTGTYKANVKKQALLRADYAGVSNYFNVDGNASKGSGYKLPFFSKKWFSNKWYRIKRLFSRQNNSWQYRQRLQVISDYQSFMAFNKPMYKPKDTLRFKAFILNKNGKPISAKRLLVRIQDDGSDDGKILGYVNSYRDGGFEHSFVLTDSLDLDLDQDYYISLEDPASAAFNAEHYDGDMDDAEYLAKKRKVFAAAKFSFEEYELKSTNFTMRTDKTEHSPGVPLGIYLKAADENDLPVQDGRVELTLTRRNAGQFKAPVVYVADTLWTKKIQLETVGETKVIVPDSIFPKADINYRISAVFLNANNESRNAYNYVDFKYENYIIKHEFITDSLSIKHYVNGKLTATPAKIYAVGVDLDTISKTTLKLPITIAVNPNVDNYRIETDSVKHTITLEKIAPDINVSGYRTADSLFIQVANPHKLPFWYWVSTDKKIYDTGNNRALFYKLKLNSSGTVRASINYIWGGKSRYNYVDIGYADKMLNIDVKQPLAVYPGQRVNTEITVTDAEGSPVANADLTAWSVTRKFPNYNIPFIPYLGKMPTPVKVNGFNELAKNDNETSATLNWQRWRHDLKLDAIEYYRFTHPTTIYKIEEPAPDNITQVAPFVVRNGEIRPVHILYIDAVPVYFDQAQQLSRYSFKVTPGKHNFKFRTADENIVIDTVFVKEGRKLIFSVNDTVINQRVNITKAPLELDKYEADRIDRYMIKVVDNFGTKLTTIEQDNNLFLLNPNPTGYYNNNRQVLVGPLLPNTAFLNVKTEPWRSFLVEPDYSYLFEPGLLKQKSIPTRYPFSTTNSPLLKSMRFTEYALTNKEVDSLWQQFLDLRSHTTALFTNPTVADKIRGELIITADGKKAPALLVKNIIVYRKNDPDYMRIYPGNTTSLGFLGAGNDYRIFFLLANNAYHIADNISVKAYGVNYYNIKLSALAADDVSKEINNIIANRITGDENTNRRSSDAEKLKEVFNEKYLDLGTFTDVMSGRVTDKDGEALIGVSIILKGTTKGAVVTDANGEFTLKVPRSGVLVARYVGFVEKEVDIRAGTMVNIVLEQQSAHLDEVVIVGYGTQKRATITGAVTTLQGKVAGILIRGNSAGGSNKPLIIVDGVPVESMDNIAADSIAETKLLKAEAATAIYGSKAAHGVIIITTKKKAAAATEVSGQAIAEGALRRNFADYAYWQPKLTTNAQGKASFNATFPDDITNWRTFVAAIGPNRQTGSAEAQIKSFKPLSANLAIPQFAVNGDEIAVLGKVLNYGTDTVKLNRSFKFNGQLLKQGSLEVSNSVIDTFKVVATGNDSIDFEYTINRESGYFDGEQRKIPVVQRGVTETKGIFEALDKDTTVTLNFDPAMGPVTFRAESSVLPTLTAETRRLRDYIYQCNEQLASKLKGLLAEKRINAYLGKAFKWDRNINEVIKNLEANKRGQGTWGWWKDADEELWISLHAIEALLDAKKAGYLIRVDVNKLADYMIYQLNSYKGIDKILCLQLLRNLDAKINYEQYITTIEAEQAAQKAPTQYDVYRLVLLKQNAGLLVNTDLLIKQSKRTTFGNIYWGENSTRFFDNAIQLSVLAYKIIKAEGKHPELLTKIRGYFLEQHQQGEWRNTYETALILETILPDVLLPGQQISTPALVLSGAKNATVSTFPYTDTLTAEKLTVKKTGTLPVYITGYQQFFNTAPQKVNKDFAVNTWFEKNGNKVSTLKGGQSVVLKAEVDVKGDAEYVMINIPIPAACSYERKNQSWQNNEVHREHFKDRVSIFCRKLKQGKYEFSIELMPRYSGKYNLNPTKAEMMYFPVFYGREALKQITIDNN